MIPRRTFADNRVHALDGSLTIESAADHGTRLHAELPYLVTVER